LIRRIRTAVRGRFGLKVFTAFAAVIVVSLTVYTVIGALRESDKIKQGLEEKGTLFAGIVARGSVVGIFAENRDLLGEAAAGVLNGKDVHAVFLYNGDGTLLYAGGAGSDDFRPERFREREVRDRKETLEFIEPVSSRSLPGADETLFLNDAPSPAAGRVIGHVRVVLSKASYHREIALLVMRNLVMMLLFITASGVILWVAVRKVMRPLETLTESVRLLEKGMPVAQMPVGTGDEIGRLAAAFNTMVLARGAAEASLRESEDRYRGLVELSPDAIYVQQQGVFVFLNVSASRLFGEPAPDRLRGLSVADHIHAASRAAANRIDLIEQGGSAVPFLAITYLRTDGAEVDAEASAAPFSHRGEPAVLVIARDVTERKGMEETIRTYQDQLYAVAAEMSLLESRVEERERYLIAADLHDFVGQNLAVCKFKLGSLGKVLASADAVRHLDEVREILAQTIDYTRSLTVELNPPVLAEIGLAPAIEVLAEGFRRTHGIEVSVQDDGAPDRAGDESRYLLFRCVRELMMNVVKHARATRAELVLGSDNGGVRIVVADNGAGFDAAQAGLKEGGFGLFTIRERMQRLGGSCEIESAPGRGTRVTLRVPIRDGARTGKGQI
jgi:PAS domain S-box-containing protein